jgi:hypothetical protein
MAMQEMARTTTGWTKNTSCSSTISAKKKSVSVPMKLNPTISLRDEIALCSMTVITAWGFAVHDQKFHGIYLSYLVNNLTLRKGDFIWAFP